MNLAHGLEAVSILAVPFFGLVTFVGTVLGLTYLLTQGKYILAVIFLVAVPCIIAFLIGLFT